MSFFRLFSRFAPGPRLSTALLGCAVSVGSLLLYITQPPLLTRLDLKVYDALLPLRAAPAPSPAPAIIDIDETSLETYGQWPWPRYLVAGLLQALAGYQVAAIGLDIMFAEQDRSSPNHMRDYLRRDKAVDLDFTGLPPELHDYDRLLAQALRGSPSVLGAYATFGLPADASPPPPVSASVIERALPDAIPYEPLLPPAGRAVLPLPALRGTAPLGFINVAPDMDGIVREVPLVVRVRDKVYPSLALRALMLGLGTRNLTVRTGPYGLEAVQVDEYSMPVSPHGTMRIPFIGPRKTYPYFSAKAVLRGETAPEKLRGRVVFVGTSAPGLLDIRATPLDSFYPGVEVHAAALDALLTGNAVSVPPWTPALQFLGILLTGLLSTGAFGFARPRVYLPVAAALVAAAIALSRHFFSEGLFVSPLYFILTVAASGAFLLLLRFRHEEQQKLHLRSVFSRYVSPEIVRRITRSRGDLLAGEERELSILFTDIRGFTSISEKLSPQQIVALLNRYFTPMTALVLQHSGTMDKFIGDALMAFWNAPLDVPQHHAKAVETALAMQEQLTLLSEDLRAEFGVDVRIGAGIHTGPAYVGNMGSQDMVNYTLIGDNVNLASRLEGLCPQYGVPTVLSGETMQGCGQTFAFQYLDSLRVKGKSQPVSVYLPLRPAEAENRRAELKAWEEARLSYASGEFTEALKGFSALRDEFPAAKLYAVFTGRANRLLAEPPVAWDGVWTLTAK